MTKCTIVPVFVDTNVFVYGYDSSEPEKRDRANAWLRYLWLGRAGRVSTQVLQELHVTLTRKLALPMSRGDARLAIEALFAWSPLVIDPAMIRRAWLIEERFRLSFWDSLIVAAASAGGCRYLLTEDLAAEQDFDGVRAINPFSLSPGDLDV